MILYDYEVTVLRKSVLSYVSKVTEQQLNDHVKLCEASGFKVMEFKYLGPRDGD